MELKYSQQAKVYKQNISSDSDLAQLLQEEEIRMLNESKYNDTFDRDESYAIPTDRHEIRRTQSASSCSNLTHEDRSTFQLLQQQENLKQQRAIEQQRLDEEFARQLQCELEMESQNTPSIRQTQQQFVHCLQHGRANSPHTLSQPNFQQQYGSRSKPPSFNDELPPYLRPVFNNQQKSQQQQTNSSHRRRQSTDEELAYQLQMQLEEEDAWYESDSNNDEDPQYRQHASKSRSSSLYNEYPQQQQQQQSLRRISGGQSPHQPQRRQPSPVQHSLQQEGNDTYNASLAHQSYSERDDHTHRSSSSSHHFDQRSVGQASHSSKHTAANHNYSNHSHALEHKSSSPHYDEQQAVIDEQIARELQEQLEFETALEQSQIGKHGASNGTKYSAVNTLPPPPPTTRRRETVLSDEELARQLQRQLEYEDQYGVEEESHAAMDVGMEEDLELLRTQEEFSRFETDSVVSELTLDDDEGSILLSRSSEEGAPHYAPHPTRMTIQQQQHVQQSQFYTSSRRGSSAVLESSCVDEKTYLESQLQTPLREVSREGTGLYLSNPNHQQQWSSPQTVHSPQPLFSTFSYVLQERSPGGISGSASVVSTATDNQSVMTKNAEDLYLAQKMRFAAPPTSVSQVRAPQLRSYVENWRRSSLGAGTENEDHDRQKEHRDHYQQRARGVRRDGVSDVDVGQSQTHHAHLEQQRCDDRRQEEQRRQGFFRQEQSQSLTYTTSRVHNSSERSHRSHHSVETRITTSEQQSSAQQQAVIEQSGVSSLSPNDGQDADKTTPKCETRDTLQSEVGHASFEDIHHDQLPVPPVRAVSGQGDKNITPQDVDNKREAGGDISDDDDLDSLAWSHLSDDESIAFAHFEAMTTHGRAHQGGHFSGQKHNHGVEGVHSVSGDSHDRTVAPTGADITVKSGANSEVEKSVGASDSSSSSPLSGASPLKRSLSSKISFLASKFDSPVQQKAVGPPVNLAHTKWVKSDEVISSPARDQSPSRGGD